MGQATTLKKISEQLNLSISTVSRALKDHPDISEKTRKKVKELAALMEYEPNALAVNLRTNKTHVIGLIVPSISNTFNESFIASAEKEARQNGFTLMILQSGEDVERETDNLKLCKNYRVDGILISVVVNSISMDIFRRYRDNGIPIVFFDRVPDTAEFDTVCIADEEAATQAAHTILHYQKKRILGLFGNTDLSITRKRKNAFETALKGAGPRIDVTYAYCSNSDEAYKAVKAALASRKKPDHIFCMSDEVLIGASKALYRNGIRIPEQISVLAMSNGFIPALLNPEITHIETSGAALGKLAMQRLIENIREKSAPRSIYLPSRFIQGHSI